MQLRSALLGLTTVILFLAGSRGAEAFLEFHPRFLGLDKIEAPLHLQLPPHMLSVTHAHKKGSNEQADDATFEAASKSQSWEEIFFYRHGDEGGQIFSICALAASAEPTTGRKLSLFNWIPPHQSTPTPRHTQQELPQEHLQPAQVLL